MTEPVRKLVSWVAVTDEDIVDYGLGTPDDQRAAEERIEIRRAATARAWHALPFYVRSWRRLRWWWFARRIGLDN